MNNELKYKIYFKKIKKKNVNFVKIVKGFLTNSEQNYQLNMINVMRHAIRSYARQEIVTRKRSECIPLSGIINQEVTHPQAGGCQESRKRNDTDGK